MADQSDIPLKKRKTEIDTTKTVVTQTVLESFKDFEVKKVIGENARSKTAVIHGIIEGADAVVLLEKEPFDVKHVHRYLCGETSLKNTLLNDIYGTYEAYPPQTENGIKVLM